MNEGFKILYKDILKDKVKFDISENWVVFTDDKCTKHKLNVRYYAYDLIQDYLVHK